MRLSLVARKLDVKPTEIINLLGEGQGKKPHGNTKLSEEQLKAVIAEFGPIPEEEDELLVPTQQGTLSPEKVDDDSPITEKSSVEDEASEDLDEKVETTTKAAVKSGAELTESETETPTEETEVESTQTEELEEAEASEDTLENSEEEASEPKKKIVLEVADLLEKDPEDLSYEEEVLIKAPKQHLPGLKIKGKIELPEKPVKEEKEGETEKTDNRKPYRKDRQHRNRRRKENPIAAERKRKEREEEKQKQLKKRKEKERKAKRYQELVSTRQPKPQPKKSKKKTSPVSKTQVIQQPQGGNIFQRFWRWMNT